MRSQRIWTFDRFLHGGRDFAFTVPMILTSLRLALSLAQHMPLKAI
jgi:hypothetical protein